MAADESSERTQDMPAVEQQETQHESPWYGHSASDSANDPLPLVGAAFAGGFVLAKILKRLGGGD
jgi:hypothetical protein